LKYFYRGEFHSDKISLDIQSPAFRFGAGFFETIFYNGERVCHLEAHIKRITRSLDHYELQYVTINFEETVLEVLRQNGLISSSARVNIYYTIAANPATATPLVVAYPYTPDQERSYRLDISPPHNDSHLSAHKSMNYMHCFLAKMAAEKRGYDDAILLDGDGMIREASTAALLFSDGSEFVTPEVKHPFPSVSLEIAKSILPIINVEQASPKPAILGKYRHAYMLNSLIGMRPVVQIGETDFEPDIEGCIEVTRRVLFP